MVQELITTHNMTKIELGSFIPAAFCLIYNSDNNVELSFYPGLNSFHFNLSEW